MKRTLLFSILAVVPAVLMSLPAAGQVNPEAAPARQEASPYKYEVYGGFSYTSLNQVTLSRHGLMGGEASLTRDWGRYFGLRAAIDYFKPELGSNSATNPGNPGDPSVYSGLAGPEFHDNIWGNFGGLVFAELGVEHTGGENMSPSTSFAGGFGGGMTYDLSHRFAVRATGDRIAGSFSPSNNTPQLNYSPHRTWNARATIGVVFRF